MSTRAHISIFNDEPKEGQERFMLYHHCDGYPDGVGSDLAAFLEQYDKDHKWWEPCRLRNFINEQDNDYEIEEHGVHGDEEYVYVINCRDKTLKCYAMSWDEDFFDTICGDEIVIPNNDFIATDTTGLKVLANALKTLYGDKIDIISKTLTKDQIHKLVDIIFK